MIEMTSTRWIALAALATACTTACAAQPAPAPAPAAPDQPAASTQAVTEAADAFPEDVEQLVAMMSGSFSSRQQAQADPNYFDIRLHMIPVWTDRSDARWLYVEQAVASAPDKPYRQRVYRVSARDDGTIESAVFTMTEPERFALAWQDASTLEALRFEDITRKEGCEVLLRRNESGFSGSTGDRTCKSELRGASYATSKVTVTEQGVDSWDQGFDDAGTQVWGATEGGYEFRPDDPQAPPAQPPK